MKHIISGPWTTAEDSENIMAASNTVQIATTVAPFRFSPNDAQRKAHRNLMAAAPDLAEALKRVLYLTENHISEQTAKICRAALDKAGAE